jgi:uncharacterized protein (DUF4415 family)
MSLQRKPKSKTDDKAANEFISGSGVAPSLPAVPANEPKPKAIKKPVALRFDADLLAKIDAAAAARGMSRNAWISYNCAEGLKNE